MARRAISVLCMLLAVLLPTPTLVAALGDIVFPPRAQMPEIPPAVFPHWFHRIRFRCSTCHTAIFPMKVTSEGITMDAIGAGKFCGACHNSEIAWGPSFDTCIRCHVQE